MNPLEVLAIIAAVGVGLVAVLAILAGALALVVGILGGIGRLLGAIPEAFHYTDGVQKFLMSCGLVLLVLLLALGVFAILCATGAVDRAWLRVELLAAVNAVLG
jgi:hypothetical protein